MFVERPFQVNQNLRTYTTIVEEIETIYADRNLLAY